MLKVEEGALIVPDMTSYCRTSIEKENEHSLQLPASCDTVQIKEELEEELPLPQSVFVGHSMEDYTEETDTPFCQVAVKEEPPSPTTEDNNLDDTVEDEHESLGVMPFEHVFIKEEGHANFSDTTLEQAAKQECPSDDTRGGNIADNIRSRFLKILGKESGTQLVCDAAPNVKSEAGCQQLIDGPGFIIPDSSSPCESESAGERESYSGKQIEEKQEEQTGEMDCNSSIHQGSVCRKQVTESDAGEMSFQCSVCKMEFTQKCRLTLHMTLHTGDKPLQCSVCEKKFTYKSSLNYHMRLHTGVNRFDCSVCEKQFTRKRSLDFHMTLHSGEKPFQCSVCKKDFPRKTYLKAHMVSQHWHEDISKFLLLK